MENVSWGCSKLYIACFESNMHVVKMFNESAMIYIVHATKQHARGDKLWKMSNESSIENLLHATKHHAHRTIVLRQ